MSIELKSRLILSKGERINEAILCAICRDILRDPLTCNACVNNFCRKCIEETARATRCCRCRQPATNLARAPRVVLRLLAKRSFACANAANGCPESLYYENIAEHETRCRFREARCRFADCPARAALARLPEHERACDFRPTNCAFCGEALRAAALPAHEVGCPRATRRCPGCAREFAQSAFLAHAQQCPRVWVQCNLCEATLRSSEFAGHDRALCLRNALGDCRRSSLRLLRALMREAESLTAHLRARAFALAFACRGCRAEVPEGALWLCLHCGRALCERCAAARAVCGKCACAACESCRAETETLCAVWQSADAIADLR